MSEFFKQPWAGRGWIGDVFIRSPEEPRYLAAKLKHKEGDLYVGLYIGRHTLMNSMAGPYVHLDMVEVKAMDRAMVVVDAEALGKDIETRGHALVYGIYFDTGKERIKAESKVAIDEVAKLLKNNSKLKLFIVGHTDDEGSIEYNMDLSSRRASAIKADLVTNYGIDVNRLGAVGMGFFSPVASNHSEKGRALNRRVELVQWRGNKY